MKNNEVFKQQIVFWLFILLMLYFTNDFRIRDLFKSIIVSPEKILNLSNVSIFIFLYLYANQLIVVQQKKNQFIKFNQNIASFDYLIINNDFSIKSYNESRKFIIPYLFIFYVSSLAFGHYIIDNFVDSDQQFNNTYLFLSIIWIKHLLLATSIYFEKNEMNKFIDLTIVQKKLSVLITLLLFFWQTFKNVNFSFNGFLNYLNLSSLKDLMELMYSAQITVISIIILNPFILALIYIVCNFKKVSMKEYYSANERKIIIENEVIINDYLKQYNSEFLFDEYNIKDEINNFTGSLRNKKSFLKFINENNLVINNTEESSEDYFEKQIVPFEQLKKFRGEYIRERNMNNLYISIYTLLIFFISYILLKSVIYKEIIRSENLFLNFMDIIYILIFYRLFIRSVEICYSFFMDIHDEPEDKKSNLDKNMRSKLALNSLLEIILFSYLLIFCVISVKIPNVNISIFLFLKNELINLVNIFMYTISVSIFNVSFESLKDLLKTKIYFIRPVHLTQVISSLVLLTICLSSYLNSKSSVKSLFLRKDKSGIQFIETTITGTERNIFNKDFKNINELYKEIDSRFVDGKISNDEYTSYVKIIKNYCFE